MHGCRVKKNVESHLASLNYLFPPSTADSSLVRRLEQRELQALMERGRIRNDRGCN